VSSSLPLPPESKGEDDTGSVGLVGRPRADELIEAVRELLSDEVIGVTSGQLHHQIRVAINVLAMVERELRDGPMLEHAHRARLALAGVSSDSQLASEIRSGAMDGREDVRPLLLADAVDRLTLINPSWLES
jgi:hypothetical protein